MARRRFAGDERVLRRKVLDRQLAPFFRGKDEPGEDTEECPICMLNFQGGLNRSSCCQQGLCSECYLQICPRASKSVRYAQLVPTRHAARAPSSAQKDPQEPSSDSSPVS
jgi:protein-arginine kinase activator protein McsA